MKDVYLLPLIDWILRFPLYLKDALCQRLFDEWSVNQFNLFSEFTRKVGRTGIEVSDIVIHHGTLEMF